jgi:hypothetical protein
MSRFLRVAIFCALVLSASAEAQVRLSAPRAEEAPDVYVVKEGDTLWDISHQFLGNPYEWPKIWSYNPAITNPHWIYPSDRLRLRPDGADSPAQAATPQSTATGSGIRLRVAESTFAPGSVRLKQLAYLDEDALEESAQIAGSPDEWMMLGPYAIVYLDFGKDERPPVGAMLSVYHEIDPDQRVDGEKGVLVRILGTVRYEGEDPETGLGRGMIVDAFEPIERGYRVAMGVTDFEVVAPKESRIDLEATVVSSLMGRIVIGAQQIVFIDKGTDDGVEKGHQFTIVYSGDRYREQIGVRRDMGDAVQRQPVPSEYPREDVAMALVVDVRKNTSTLAIMESRHNVRVGDQARLRRSR